jgi:hypothetical protein
MSNKPHTYRLGFAASSIPSVEVAVVEVRTSEPIGVNDLHEKFVAALDAWVRETPEGQQLHLQLGDPMTIGMVLAGLDSFTGPILEFWLAQAEMAAMQVWMSSAVYDLDELVGE